MASPRDVPFQNPDLPIDARVDDLVGRLTARREGGADAARGAGDRAPGHPRLQLVERGAARRRARRRRDGLPAGDRPGGDVERRALLHEVAVAISDEARAKHHEYLRQGDHGMYKGLTFWSPNINIFRDPRWGRGHETYGEDPYLTARLGVAFCRGLQGDDPTLPEGGRDAQALRRAQRPRGGCATASTPSSARRTCARPTCPRSRPASPRRRPRASWPPTTAPTASRAAGSPTLLGKILRGEWGFGGFVVSDCWAIKDFHENHKVDADVRAVGGDGGEGGLRPELRLHLRAHPGRRSRRGCSTEADIDVCVQAPVPGAHAARACSTRRRACRGRRSRTTGTTATEHHALARAAARESIVLLKNEGGCCRCGRTSAASR